VIAKVIGVAAVVALLVGGELWVQTLPSRVEAAALPDHRGDPEAGERIFNAAGCASCHAAKGATGDDRLLLGGGMELATDFGVFRVPNISPDPQTGIGRWRPVDLVNAMMFGASPDGSHYYPSFPYTSYSRMTVADVLDLKAFLDTLPPVSNRVADHDLGFPYNVRRGLAFWKLLYLDPRPVVALPDDAPDEVKRGRYLVEGPGHCGECHTVRNAIGGLDTSQWLAGAHNPEGPGRIPNITPGPEGIGEWSTGDIVSSFETGFLPDYDTFGGQMAAVQANLARLPKADLEAIAAYLKAVASLPDAVPAATN
jgi:mono/diheme cytochrome c family protein